MLSRYRFDTGTIWAGSSLSSPSMRGAECGASAWLSRRALRSGQLLSSEDFEKCCVPVYLAVAPEIFDRELQIPVASADSADLDARVLLWPIGAKDAQHPHADGWAVFAAVRGRLAVHERHNGEPQPERAVPLCDPEMLTAIDGITHHLHNRGNEVALSVHVFGT
jgi:hypothetical protein